MGETHKKERFDIRIDEQGVGTRPRKDEKQNKNNLDSWYYLGVVGQIGFSIALPIAGGAILGSFIDRQMSIYPKATLGLLFFGVVVSCVTFYQTIKTILKGTEGTKSTGSMGSK
ncbi:AtpZ/AtpI family protein [Candidatus Gottesmanbacteria bacterium]|nr:AtpZ/AtpI family protein [Candidatus Gottesmanbacteria bacterium]